MTRITSTADSSPAASAQDSAAGSDTPASRSAGHLIVAQLEAEGVERIYCVPGESYLNVLDGLHDSAIRTITCRQEAGAGFMALAEGRMTGRPGIAMVTRGPGAANVMIAAHTAYQDATPLVIFAGLIPTDHRGREAFQEFDLAGWFGTTVKKTLILDHPDEAAALVADAMHTAASGRPGPVIVGLPEDPQLITTQADTVTPRPVPEVVPTAAQIASVAEAVARARRPVLIVGGERWDEQSSRTVADWAAGLGMGIIADFRAYDGIDHDEPHYLGALGFGSAPLTRKAFDEADLHVYLGCQRTDVSTNSYSIGCSPDHTIVISPDPDLHAHFGPVDEQIIATTRGFAQALTSTDATTSADATTGTEATTASGTETNLPDWVTETRQRFQQWREIPAPTGDEDPAYVDMDTAFGEVRRLLPDDAIITYGAGNYSGWASRYLPVHSFPSVLGPRNGAMGFGMPAAVAAALVCPDRPVLAVAGDGCFLMNGQEFATAVAHDLNITVIINDNSVYGTIVGHQERDYPGRPEGTGLKNPDFAAYANAFGGVGFSVSRTEDFAGAFEAALNHPGPALVHVRTDPAIRFTRS
ncbi:thiamine pyrophosphate-dependent enzyme [Brevibacterium luteolum]|uniref:thiamine pyrophosphate-dependent enzyme n=1 Tax=Brevibacterium luteolum TaxID=199591 RepID=UPI00387964A6